jgi:formylglycine-generating enzyme required for sulfatase activity
VIRGGGWDYYVGGRCQSACRAAHSPSTRFDYLGFRVALDADSSPTSKDGRAEVPK